MEIINKMKKNKKRIYTVIVAVIFILVIIFFAIPFATRIKRKYNIEKDLESVYKEADIISVKLNSEPISKAELESDTFLMGEDLPKEDLYSFSFYDSNDNVGNGFATEDGTVVFDTYANYYYTDEAIKQFEDVVDFEKNFPDLRYYVRKEDVYYNTWRIVSTHDCTSFEGYKKARTVGYLNHYYYGNGGYPALIVGLEDTSEGTIEAINKRLSDADFDVYIKYFIMTGDWSDEDSLFFEDSCGSYYPFGKSYEETILGK